MFYACMATLFCVGVGVTGLVLSMIDIDRFNFGLYLALLSVVGSTVSIAFWIISPTICRNPRSVQNIFDKYGYKLNPLRDFIRRHFGNRKRRRLRRRLEEEDLEDVPRLEKRFKKKKRNRKPCRTNSEESTSTALIITHERIGDSDCGQTTSSGYYSPQATVCNPIEEEHYGDNLILLDETVNSPEGHVVMIPYQLIQGDRLVHSKSAYTIISKDHPVVRSSSLQTFV